jgi:hypothetical protein
LMETAEEKALQHKMKVQEHGLVDGETLKPLNPKAPKPQSP